jgi:hypothetical protein
MGRTSIAALAMASLWFCGFVAMSAQSGRSSVEGVWELRDITFTKPPPNPPNKPTGIVIFSGRHYSIMYLGNSARPDLPFTEIGKATADQLRAVWAPLTANSGTFQVAGNTTLTTRATVAKNTAPMASGVFQEYTFTLKGDVLTLTLAKNATGAVDNPPTLHLVRAK